MLTEQEANDLANGKRMRLLDKVQSAKAERNRLIDKLIANLGNLRDDGAGYVRDCDVSQLDALLRKASDAQRELMEYVREHNATIEQAEQGACILTRSFSIA